MAQWWPWAMCVTITSRFTVSIILVVITTVKERRVVAISLLHSNVTFVDILIRHWIESATTMLIVAFTFALMVRERRRSCEWSKIFIDRSQCVLCIYRTCDRLCLYGRGHTLLIANTAWQSYWYHTGSAPMFSHRVPY